MGSKDERSRSAKHIVFGRRDIVGDFGVKITSAQREYYRYTGVSADIERHGTGSNWHEFARPRANKREQRPE
jgi:hypothetical protein